MPEKNIFPHGLFFPLNVSLSFLASLLCFIICLAPQKITCIYLGGGLCKIHVNLIRTQTLLYLLYIIFQPHYFVCGYSVFPILLVVRVSCPYWMSLALDHIWRAYFRAVYSISLVCVSVFMLLHTICITGALRWHQW